MLKRLFGFGASLGVGAVVGVICGAASAVFLWLLEAATQMRDSHDVLIFGLPFAGLAMGAVYECFAGPTRNGTNLIIETIRGLGARVPIRMAPMISLGTLATHLFGGSAGREGTAVQMGGSLADGVAQVLKLGPTLRRQALIAGVAGGFGSVFGTPISGAVFALEFATLGKIDFESALPALAAAFVGDWVTRGLGTVHTRYPQVLAAPMTPGLLALWVVFAVAIALVATVFIESTQGLRRLGERSLPGRASRMFVGGLIVVVLWRISGTSDYVGLGMPFIVRTFTDPSLPVYAFAAKGLFTVVTLGAGFLGGEVTTLFFIGAALGNVLARGLGLPLGLGAGVGMAAMFGTAAKTPLAVSVMAMELLGASVFPHVVLVAVLATALSGRRSIYEAQLE